MDDAFRCCCCCFWITHRIATIFLLWINIIFLCVGVVLSLFYYDDKLLMNRFFQDEFEMSMAFIFVLIEVLVLFSAIFFAFRRKTSMLSFATVMILLESFFIIYVAVRVHYNRKNFRHIWDYIFESAISHFPEGKLKEFCTETEQSMHLTSGILFYSIFVLVLIFKLCCAVVVNNYKNKQETIRIENIFREVVLGTKRLNSSRPTSYEIYSTITEMIDKPFY